MILNKTMKINATPDSGRLEFLGDMSLVVQPDHPEKVVVDATNLPRSSYNLQSLHLEQPPDEFARSNTIIVYRQVNLVTIL